MGSPSVDPVILWVLGVLVTLLTALVAAIYMSVRKDQEKTDEYISEVKGEAEGRLLQYKRDVEKQFRDIWVEVNKLRDKSNVIDSDHRVLCQKHEDQFSSLESKLSEQKGDIYKWRNLLTETKSNLENKLTVVERSIRALADQVSQMMK